MDSNTQYGGDLKEAKPALGELTNAFHSTHMTECLRQIILQLNRERKRMQLDSISYGDITIRSRK